MEGRYWFMVNGGELMVQRQVSGQSVVNKLLNGGRLMVKELLRDG